MTDNRPRCAWPSDDAKMIAYHDDEWGVPVRDGQALFAKLTLDGFQAGLSWRTILYKRDAFERAFHKFEPRRVAKFGDKEIARLLADPGIVRHRGKIEAAIGNARAYLAVEEEGDFSQLLWSVVGGETVRHRLRSSKEIPTETKESREMSKLLRARGFKFVGPTICYAFMQAVGMVDDHLLGCFRRGGK